MSSPAMVAAATKGTASRTASLAPPLSRAVLQSCRARASRRAASRFRACVARLAAACRATAAARRCLFKRSAFCRAALALAAARRAARTSAADGPGAGGSTATGGGGAGCTTAGGGAGRGGGGGGGGGGGLTGGGSGLGPAADAGPVCAPANPTATAIRTSAIAWNRRLDCPPAPTTAPRTYEDLPTAPDAGTICARCE